MAILRTVTLIISCTLVLVTHAQTTDSTQKARVEKSVFGIQVGLLGVWAYTELRLTDRIALRGEAGGITIIRLFIDSGTDDFGAGITFRPFTAIASRWYYKIGYCKNPVKKFRRKGVLQSKLKDVTDNSGNFVSLRVEYLHSPPPFPAEFFSGSSPLNSQEKTIALLAVWGIRRNIGQHFNYEASVGMGFQCAFDGTWFNGRRKSPVLGNHIRVQVGIGYRFHFRKKTPSLRTKHRQTR